MTIPSLSVILMAHHCVLAVYACTPRTSSSIPTATAPNAIAVPCSFLSRRKRPVTTRNFAREKGCVKDINQEAGGLMRVTLDRESPLYHVIYNQRTSCLPHQQSSRGPGYRATQSMQHPLHSHAQHPDLSHDQHQSAPTSTSHQCLLVACSASPDKLSQEPSASLWCALCRPHQPSASRRGADRRAPVRPVLSW